MGALGWLTFLGFAGSEAFYITTPPKIVALADLRDFAKMAEVSLVSLTAELRDFAHTPTPRPVSVTADLRDWAKTAEVSLSTVTAELRDFLKMAPTRGAD